MKHLLLIIIFQCIVSSLLSEDSMPKLVKLTEDPQKMAVLYDKSEVFHQLFSERLMSVDVVTFSKAELPLEVAEFGFSDGHVSARGVTFVVGDGKILSVDLESKKIFLTDVATVYQKLDIKDVELEIMENALKKIMSDKEKK